MPGWEIVRTLGTEEEASLVVGFLAARGIEATIESLRFHQEPVNFGRLGEVRVLVADGEAERARGLLAEAGMMPAEPPGAGETGDGDEPEVAAETSEDA
jgi:hypothetical protein